MQNVWNVLCSRTIVDSKTNNLSILNVLEQVNVTFAEGSAEPPIVIPMEWCLATMWRRDDKDKPDQGTARITVLGANNQQIGESTFDIDLTIHERIRLLHEQNMLLVTGPGTHWFIVELRQASGDWEKVGKVPLQITDTGSAQQGVSPN